MDDLFVRLGPAVREAEEAFWAVIARRFPGGQIGFDLEQKRKYHNLADVVAWIEVIPAAARPVGQPDGTKD